MRRYFFLLSFFTFSLIASPASAWEETDHYRVRLNSGETVHLYKGELTLRGVRGLVSRDSSVFVPQTDIKELHRYGGNKAWKYARTGILCGLGISAVLLTVALIEDAHSPWVSVDREIALGGTVLLCTSGAFIGAVWGSREEKWESVPVNVGIRLSPKENAAMLSLQISF